MAQHEHDDDDADMHNAAHDHAQLPYDEAQVGREILADREWVFDKFVSFSAWNLVLIFAILALLALTQT